MAFVIVTGKKKGGWKDREIQDGVAMKKYEEIQGEKSNQKINIHHRHCPSSPDAPHALLTLPANGVPPAALASAPQTV
jgi:hypothetical protein